MASSTEIRSFIIVCWLASMAFSFMIPPSELLPSAVSAATTSKYEAFASEMWQQPKFNVPFSSEWYYWQSTPGQTTNENIDYGKLKWLFNGTHMYYYFSIPSLNIQFHEYIINDTLYLWTQNSNDSRVDCYSYKLEFDIIPNYFKNSSFCGLTNSPFVNMNPVLPENAFLRSLYALSNSSNTTSTTPAPSPSPTPTPQPTAPPTKYYPMKDAEAIWIGYLSTERIFGRNITYIVTSNQNGTIGRLHITLNINSINLQTAVTKSEILWLKNISWNPWNKNENGINAILPQKCLLRPINEPTKAPTASPIYAPSPSKSPTIPPSIYVRNSVCNLPSTMVIIYVALIALFLLLLFCWYARKNNVLSRMMNGTDHSITVSSEMRHHYHSTNRYKYKSNVAHSHKNKSPKHHNKQHVHRDNAYDNRYNKNYTAAVPRKTSDRYVGDDDSISDIEYVAPRDERDRYHKLSNSDVIRHDDDEPLYS